MKEKKTVKSENLLKRLVNLQLQTDALPPLPPLEKAKLDHALALDQLYYSSQVEGSKLTKEMIEKAIHGKGLSTT